MRAAIDELIRCLCIEKDQYQNCLKLSLLKRDAIIKGNTNSLDEIINEEKILVDGISDLEEKRRQIVLKHFGNENMTITEIIGLLDDKEQKEKLGSLTEEFCKLIDECRSINNLNHSMLKRNLNYINYMMSFIMAEENTYSLDSGGEGRQKINIFDKRV